MKVLKEEKLKKINLTEEEDNKSDASLNEQFKLKK